LPLLFLYSGVDSSSSDSLLLLFSFGVFCLGGGFFLRLKDLPGSGISLEFGEGLGKPVSKRKSELSDLSSLEVISNYGAYASSSSFLKSFIVNIYSGYTFL
jgi:hypothetical protein